ncbi:hypothetical protein SNE40_005009 [Patella caerulea]|uniref:ubiquitinyl hydrolase 1 n=1 Tax=Patella caerulea TaxID=87958 RepID=A0AAN8PYV1_PATCE
MNHENMKKTKIVDEFVKNTLTDRHLAQEILEKNNWDLKRAYGSIEKMCKDRNMAQHPRQITGSHTIGRTGGFLESQEYSRHGSGLVSGYGIPVSTRSSTISGSATNPSVRSTIPRFPVEPLQTDGSQQKGHALPPSNERIIPIQVISSNTTSSPKRLVQQKAVIEEPHPSQGQRSSQAYTKEKTPPKTEQSSTISNKPEPKLKRGISNIMENATLLTETRSCILHDIEEDSHDHMYILTFVLPDLTVHNDGFRAFLQKELVETSTLVSLEQAGRLNWWAEMRICQRLWPMATTGDGNCLLHAASLAMWGVHDRELILRNALYDLLTKSTYRDALYRRWRWQQTITNKESGLVFSESEWNAEWANLLKLASPKPRTLPDQESNRRHSCCDSPLTQGSDTPVVYESLEEFHVFVLSHVLERPIIIVADKVLKDSSGEALAPIPFGGIYLPFECGSRYYRSPLLLTYDAAHFSALVPMEQENPNHPTAAIPLVDPEFQLLPVHFYFDPGAKYDWNKSSNKTTSDTSNEDKLNLLQKFMDVEKLPIPNFYCENDMESDKNSIGSYDSDDNVGCVSKGEKKKDAKVTQQMQNIGKQFGSIGKTVGKKIKKNFGNFGKAAKVSQDSEKSGQRKASVGSIITQSTKVITTIATAADKDRVWCARLSTQRTENQQLMVKNYMHNARERYEKDRELKRQKGEEIRSRVNEISNNANQNMCVTPGCNLYGSPDFAYMCSNCYSRQKSIVGGQQQGMYNNSLPGRGRPADGIDRYGQAYDDAQKYGKSKFYAPADAFNKPPELTSNRVNLIKNNLDRPRSADDVRTSEQYKLRDRTPSPDYDNVDYPSERKTELGLSNGKKCFSAGCTFYGKPETDNLCSACYKEKRDLLLNKAKTLTRI